VSEHHPAIVQTAQGWWVLRRDSHLSRWVEQAQRLDHDQPVLQKLRPYIRPATTVFDLGAALGDHTIFYLDAVGPGGLVAAFEPHPIQFECLRRNCPTALCFPYAVGDKEQEVWLFHEPDVIAGSRLIDPALQWPMTKHRQVKIDDVQLPGPISFMKIDIEGSEPAALRGAAETIITNRPVIWIEINPIALERQGYTTGELEDVLINQLGYRVEEFYPPQGGWNGLNGETQCDALCVPM
jgi:FkbM family methyltransferase